MHVLVVDDDAPSVKMIAFLLREEGYTVSTADNGLSALAQGDKEKPDLVILDVIMPGMNGYEVCQEMRSDPILKDVPILFLTAKAKDEDRISGFKAGADDYLSKPFNMEELILRVRAILKRSRGARPGRRPGAPAPPARAS